MTLLSSCNISNPEQLLQAPQLTVSRREMITAVEKFKPQNTVDYSAFYYQDDKPTNMIIKDLNNDGQNEIISLYRSKVTEKIGIVILQKNEIDWQKQFEYFFDTYEIASIWIDDLDYDDKREILIQNYSYDKNYNKNHNPSKTNNQEFIIIYNDGYTYDYIDKNPYTVMAIDNIDSQNDREMIVVEKSQQPDKENIVNLIIYDFDKGSLKKIVGKTFMDMPDPYNITVGKVSRDSKGIFINYLNDEYHASTNIFFYNEIQNQILSSKDVIGFNTSDYVLNVESEDIDKDGIIEVGYYFKSPNFTVPVEDISQMGLINGYFKILPGNKLELVKEIYYDYNLEYLINIPKSFKGKYTLNLSEDGMTTTINYITEKAKEVPLLVIKKIDKWDIELNPKEYEDIQLISDNGDYVIAGIVENNSDALYGKNRQEYEDMRQEIIVLSNIIAKQKYQKGSIR